MRISNLVSDLKSDRHSLRKKMTPFWRFIANLAVGIPETMRKLQEAIVNMTNLSQAMIRNKDTSEKLHQIQQAIEEYRATSK